MSSPLDNASMTDVLQDLATGKTTASALTKAYLARIEAYNKNGPALNAIITVNPQARQIAAQQDAEIAKTGVDYASSGWVTHSAPQLDVALDIEM